MHEASARIKLIDVPGPDVLGEFTDAEIRQMVHDGTL